MFRLLVRCVFAAALAVFGGCASASLPPAVAYAPHHPPNFRIQLSPGYRLEPQQGIDTTVWRIWKPDGVDISYDANDLPRLEPLESKPVNTWIRECDWIKGQMSSNRPESMPTPTPQNDRGDADCGLWIDDETQRLSVSVRFPDLAIFSARDLRRMDQVREVLTMVLTYEPGSFDRAMFIDGPTLQRQIDRGWNVKRDGPKLLGDAVEWEAVDVIAVLARAGVDVNGLTAAGVPYLHEAVGRNLYLSARALLQAGAKPVVRTPKELFVPVMSAYVSSEMLQLFLDRDVDVNRANAYGWTMLQAASSVGNTNAVRTLLARGARIDAQDSYGRTPLMAAAESHREIVALLIERGAALDLRDREGKTALGLVEAAVARNEMFIRRSEDALKEIQLQAARQGADPDSVSARAIKLDLERVRRALPIAKETAALLVRSGAKR